MTLMQDDSVEIHSIETQALVQVIPPTTPTPYRTMLGASSHGFNILPSSKSKRLRRVAVPLLRVTNPALPPSLDSGDINDVGGANSL